MNTLITLIASHQVLVTFIVTGVYSAYVSSLDAPTATSTPLYRFVFKFSNALACNFSRSRNTAVESSPNFQPAVDLHNAINGIPKV